MTSERIKEIQMTTAYPNSISVQQALLQVWNECEQDKVNMESEVIQKLKDPNFYIVNSLKYLSKEDIYSIGKKLLKRAE